MIDRCNQIKRDIFFLRKGIFKQDLIFILLDDIAESMSILKMDIFVLFLYNCKDELSILESLYSENELIVYFGLVLNWM